MVSHPRSTSSLNPTPGEAEASRGQRNQWLPGALHPLELRGFQGQTRVTRYCQGTLASALLGGVDNNADDQARTQIHWTEVAGTCLIGSPGEAEAHVREMQRNGDSCSSPWKS